MGNKKKIAILMFMCIIIHINLYVAYIKISTKKNEHRLQLQNYKAVTACKILFMGDSHTVRSLDLSKIDSSYSLAFYGENNMMNYYKLKHLIENHYCIPKYIVLPCDIVTHTYGFNLARNNKSFYYDFIPFSEASNLSNNLFTAYLDYFKVKLFPYIDWQYALNKVNMDREKKSKIKFSNLPIDKQRKSASFFIEDELLKNRNKSSFYNSRALNYLQKTIDLCNQKKIKLIFVKFPLTKFIFENIKTNVDSTYLTKRPSEIIINKNNIPILDFEYIYQNNTELFFDTHHLNANGKEKFTEVFKLKIDSLLKIY
ncbi:MAG: hypothetical protein IPH32_10940 [Bacteroidetes bacterium]|nr:hypothetical protein [Bacteroidota bacterium]